MKRLFLIISTAALGCVAYWAIATSRATVESAPYIVVRKQGAFEIRNYPKLQVVSTSMESGDNGAFMRLFRYITGENDAGAKIAMTTPVLLDRTGGSTGKMSFVLPQGAENAGSPAPKGKAVALATLRAGRVAAYRYSGAPSPAHEAEATRQLRGWLARQEIPAEAKPVVAYYDPPWTPSFMRRNEILIPLGK